MGDAQQEKQREALRQGCGGCAVLLAAVFVIVGYWFYEAMQSDAERRERIAAELAQPAAIQIDSVDLWAAYTKNGTAAVRQYDDRVIAVHGTVESVTNSEINQIVYLGPKYNGQSIRCYFSTDDAGALEQLVVGQGITIKGVGSLGAGIILLEQCVIGR